jgi:signal transduction histidine kinase
MHKIVLVLKKNIKSEAQYETDDPEISVLIKQAYDVRINDIVLSVELTEQALRNAELRQNYFLIATAKSQLGLLKMIQGNFKESIELSEESLTYFEKTRNNKGIADAKYNMASVYYKTDNFYIGLQYLLDCLRIYRQLNDYASQGRVLKSIGTIYEYFGDQDNAIESYHKSIEASRQAKDLTLESNAYNPLSGIYLKRGQHQLAMSTIEKSIAIKEKTKDIRGLAFALYGRGKVNLKLKNFELALTDLNASLYLQLKMGDKLGLAMAYNKLGLLYLDMKDYLKAEEYLLRALQTGDAYNIRFIRFKALYNLHVTSRAQGKTEEALEYLEKYIVIKETVINSYTQSAIKSYEAISKIESLELEAKAQREKTQIIEEKNAELDSFFYRVSHDLKGPISSLLGLHNLIKHESMDSRALEYFDMYQAQLLRINNIVLDLINLTRMNHPGERAIKINFKALLTDCINSYHYLPTFKHVKFIREVDEPLDFHAEWAIMNTILQNLVENAIKYADLEKDPFVKISIGIENERLKIIVEDNGLGIRSDLQPKVFDMFFRANDQIPGTGLGLYILKRAVERLHGEVIFKSELMVGSTFTILLPAS